MRRGHVGAVCALALMFVFACGVVRETYLGKVKDVVEAHHEAKDSWDITAAPNKGDWSQYDISKVAEAPRRPLAIQKRGLRPSPEFRKAFKTGKRILNMMEKPAQERQTFTDPSDLQGWGWTSTEMSEDVVKSTLGNYAVALKAKGISVDSPTLSGVKWTHSLETVHDGVKYPATGGSYALILDPSQGLLISTLSYGPQHHLQNPQNPSHPLPATTPPPKLQHWADLAYLTWHSRTTPETRNNLKYIAAINAINEHTVHVVSEALKKDGVASGEPPGWPGHIFTRVRPGPFSRSEVFPAVLGTPNLRGAGWLVAQYWEQLGGRKVGAVTVFDSSGFLNAKGGVQVSFLVEVVG